MSEAREVEQSASESTEESVTSTETVDQTTSNETTQTTDRPAAAAPDWKDREMARLRERRRAADAEIAELKARLQTTTPVQTQTTTQLDPVEDFNRRVAAEVQKQLPVAAAQQDFNRRCNETVEKGRETYGATEFDGRVQRLRSVVDMTDPEGAAKFNNFVSAALETGDAARLVYELGEKPEEASRIMGLTPIKMAVELARMANPAAPTGEVSRAPRPITPIGNGAANRNPINPDDAERADQLSTAEWMRRRETQLKDRYGATRRIQ